MSLNYHDGFALWNWDAAPAANVSVNTAAGWTYRADRWTFSGVGVERAGSSWSYAAYYDPVLTGDFEWSCVQVAVTGGADNSFQFGVAGSTLNASAALHQQSGDTWWVAYRGVGAAVTLSLMNNQSVITTATRDIVAGDALSLRRSAGRLALRHNGTEIAVFAASGHAGAYRPAFGHGGAAFEAVGYASMNYALS